MNTFSKACGFVYKNARPIDLLRWQYHFENGSKEAVLNALAAYQNEDGGFAHALEADSWNLNSSPIQTWTATEILREIGCTDRDNAIIKGILRYLASGSDFDGDIWLNSIKSNNDFPHASWWHVENDSYDKTYNPSACLAGFIIRFADKQSELYRLECHVAKEACEHLLNENSFDEMHLLPCYIRLMQYCEEVGETGVIDLDALKARLVRGVDKCITRDTDKWKTSYICKPSQLFDSKDSVFYSGNEDIARYECEFIEDSQLGDGSWSIPWKWKDYPAEWAISKNWWKSTVIILNMLYMRNMSK